MHGKLRLLVLGALGVVFGDIGTSPLYTMHETFLPEHGLHPHPETVIGVLSLVTWTLIMVVAVKYVSVVMRADNKGEGGIMALMALAQRAVRGSNRMRKLVMLMALLGGALFFGDSVITPSISVLSAVEGLEVATPALSRWVVPITVIVLFGLFALQRHGTARVGALFGPVMTIWFLALAAVGVWNVIRAPAVLAALNPWYAAQFFMAHGKTSMLALGSVVLCVTGAEALYTDMGHFGRFPIRAAWFGFVLPALLLNYYGQGAMLLHHPEAIANPFYHAVPDWALYPMIGLATLATVIASQAVISGAFTVFRQAVQLGFMPRMQVVQTSREAIGQVFLPWINRVLMISVILTVIAFGSSNALAGAYGIAVTGTMAIDTVLVMVVARRMWHWNRLLVLLVLLVFLTIDISYFGANTLKIPDGGWFPLALGLCTFTIMTTWRRGRDLLVREMQQGGLALKPFIEAMREHPPLRVPGAAVFLTANQHAVPHALLHNLKHNKVLHERNVLLTVEMLETPVADPDERIRIDAMGDEFYGIELHFGFAEVPNVPQALAQCARAGLAFDMMDTTFFLSRENIVADKRRPGMALWRDKLFAFMARNALPATAFFQIPGNRLIELGAQVEI
ncbi:MAG: potassium transporter Kup [Rhodanobacter sp.]|nr:MAG: potassium transporter Kup [Rhodanobacter sp.]TAM12708.1 MAG: potassium transporter Kup [Rhodanobacter sp.]TAM35424.1 MAG: potassium transporter Kup [Rhodanobacter sp.]